METAEALARAGVGSLAAGAGVGPAAGGVAGVGHAVAAAGMAQRGPLATFDALLQAYLDHNALVNDAARAAFLRDRVGFKPTLAETFKEGPGDLEVFARLFDAVLRVATTCMVGRLYGPSEDLGAANFLGAFEGAALALARTALNDMAASDQAALRLHGALLSLLRSYLPPPGVTSSSAAITMAAPSMVPRTQSMRP